MSRYSDNDRTYAINVWGVNESNETDLYKLSYTDISFAPDSETNFDGDINASTNANVDISGIISATDADGDLSFSIFSAATNGSATIVSQSDNSAVWLYNPANDFSGNDTFTVRTHSIFNGVVLDSSNGYTGFTTDQVISIFVDKEATFSGDLSGTTNANIDISGRISAKEENGIPSFTYTLINGSELSNGTSGTATAINWYNGMASGVTGRDTVTTVTTSNILYKINANGFKNCTSLTTLTMYYQGSETIEFGSHAFKLCSSLSEIKLYFPADSTLSVGSLAFDGVSSSGTLYAYYDWRSSLGLGSWDYVEITGEVSFSISSAATKGTASISSQADNSAVWLYSPNTNVTGTDTFTIRTRDLSGGTTDQVISIFVDTEAIFTNDLTGSTNANVDVSGRMTADDADGDVTFSISSGATSGTASIYSQADNSAVWLYSPNTDFSGTDTFTVRTTDTSGGTTDQVISIFVDEEATFSDDLTGSTNANVDVSGRVTADDDDGDVTSFQSQFLFL